MSNIFQLLALIGFILLFWLFNFHIGNELSYNYIQIEITVSVFAYIILTILIRASSMIGLKEFFNLYKNFYKNKCCNFSKYLCTLYLINSLIGKCKKKQKKEKINNDNIDGLNINNINKEKDKKCGNTEFQEESTFHEKNFEEKSEKNKERDEILEKFCFFFFSILSAFAIVEINRGIFASFHNISSKNIFYPILFVYTGAFLLSLLFYFF